MLSIVWLAFVVRLINLNGRPLWYDEAFAILYAEKSFPTMLYGTITQIEGAAADVHPLFYYSLLHGWMALGGQSLLAVRLLSVFFSLLTVAMLYLLGKLLFERRVGLLTALLASFSPFLVYYGQETRMYALLGLAAVSLVYAFCRAWLNGRWQWWLLMGVLGAVTLYAHNLGAMFIAALDLWVLWQWLRARRPLHWQGLLLAHLTMLLLFAPWLAILPAQLGKIQQSYWVQQPGVVELLQTTLIFHFAYDNQALPSWLLPLAFAFSLFIPAVLVLEWRRHKRIKLAYSETFPHALSLLLFLVIGPILLTFLISQIRPVYIARALLPSAAIYLLLVVAVLSQRQTPRPIKWGLALPSLLIMLLALWNHYTYVDFPRSTFAELAAFLQTEANPTTDAIVHSNKLTFFPAHYYDRQLPMRYIADAPGSPADTLALPTQGALGLYAEVDLETAVSQAPVVWFVIFQPALDEYEEAGKIQPQLAWLNGHYTQKESHQFHDLWLYKYSREGRE